MDPFLSAPIAASVDSANQSDVCTSDTEIISVGSEEFALCDEAMEGPLFPAEGVTQELRSKKKRGRPPKHLKYSSLQGLLPSLNSGDGSSEL